MIKGLCSSRTLAQLTAIVRVRIRQAIKLMLGKTEPVRRLVDLADGRRPQYAAAFANVAARLLLKDAQAFALPCSISVHPSVMRVRRPICTGCTAIHIDQVESIVIVTRDAWRLAGVAAEDSKHPMISSA